MKNSRVETKWLPFAFGLLAIWRQHVSTQQQSQKRWQRSSLLQCRRKPASRFCKAVQRTVLYLGEINDQQPVAWRKTLSVFDEQQQEYENLCLFPDDREIPADAVDTLQVKLSGLELRSPPMFGSCWLACELRRNVAVV